MRRKADVGKRVRLNERGVSILQNTYGYTGKSGRVKTGKIIGYSSDETRDGTCYEVVMNSEKVPEVIFLYSKEFELV